MKTTSIVLWSCLVVLLLVAVSFVFWDELFGYTTLQGPIGIEARP